jgi:hypothetical protein
MSVQTQVPLITGLTIQPLRPAELATASPGLLPWLWRRYLAQGKITALVSQAKSGKTTLVAHLLARMAATVQAPCKHKNQSNLLDRSAGPGDKSVGRPTVLDHYVKSGFKLSPAAAAGELGRS